MAEPVEIAPYACAPGASGVEILGTCVEVDPFLHAILYALVPIFGFFQIALAGPKWRARVRGWLYGATWSTAYAGLLDQTLTTLTRFFGPPLSWRAFERCFALAMVYAVGFLLIQGALLESKRRRKG